MHAKQVLEDIAFYQLLLVIPQPLYYMVGELIKIFGPYHDLYYPNKSAILGQFVLIMVLYTPFFMNYYMVRRIIETNVRILYPSYDFKTGKIMMNDKTETNLHSPANEPLTDAELESIAPPSEPNEAITEEDPF